MKKLILLALAAVIITGCVETKAEQRGNITGDVVTIKGCEYIVNVNHVYMSGNTYVYTHKGNCKFCAERKKQELKELVKELKGE